MRNNNVYPILVTKRILVPMIWRQLSFLILLQWLLLCNKAYFFIMEGGCKITRNIWKDSQFPCNTCRVSSVLSNHWLHLHLTKDKILGKFPFGHLAQLSDSFWQNEGEREYHSVLDMTWEQPCIVSVNFLKIIKIAVMVFWKTCFIVTLTFQN